MSDSSVVNNASIESYSSVQTFQGDEGFFVTHPWIGHYEQGVPAHVAVPDHALTWLIDRTSSRYPGNTAFIYYGTKLTYAQFSSYANDFASALRRLGVQKGDRVAIALPNIPQYPIAFYGALRAGAVVVPTNPLYTEREMQYQLADSGARVLVMLDAFYPIVRAVRKQTALEHIIVTSAADFLPPVLRALYPLDQRRVRQPEPRLTRKELHEDQTLHTFLESHGEDSSALNLPVPVSAEDLAVLQYTGGTTGLSKGAMLTHRALLANALQTCSWLPRVREGEEVVLCVAPFFHAYGMTVGMNFSMLVAATMVLLPRFKVYPREVEEVLFQHPTVAEAAVVGMPDDYRGERVAAFVVLKPGVEASEQTRQELLQFCKQGLASYKVPKVLEFRESLPKSLIGKVVRRELRAERTA